MNDYHIVTAFAADDLATQVVSNLREGYILVGGVSITHNPDGVTGKKLIYA
ncbi:MAG: DUF1737 domain-containing protein [Bacteroidota bacterium]